VNLKDLNELTKYSLSQLELLKQLWKDCMYYVDYRKKWRFYYCWYYLYILNKKVHIFYLFFAPSTFTQLLSIIVFCPKKKKFIQLKMSMLERFHGTSTVNENDVFSEEIQQE
jgi:hypothetical protein